MPNLEVFMDASGTWGCEASLDPMWFHLEWSDRLQPLSIAVKEMVQVVLAAASVGWEGGPICDRQHGSS